MLRGNRTCFPETSDTGAPGLIKSDIQQTSENSEVKENDLSATMAGGKTTPSHFYVVDKTFDFKGTFILQFQLHKAKA